VFISGLIVIFAFFCESIFGFGGGLISIPLLGTLGNVKNAVLFVLIFQLLMGFVTYKNLKHADWNLLKKLGLGILIGVILGSLNLTIADESILRKILGFTVALVLIKSLFFPKLVIKPGSKVTEIFVGLVGGYLQGVIGIGGPVFTMYLISTKITKEVFRSTLMIIFFSTSVYRFIFSLATQPGYINTVGSALIIVPFFIIATILGNRLAGKIDDKYFRYGIHMLHLLTSISLIFRG
jgi:uncharacterized protein